uniref:Ribonuclease A-domain domain-containing protein n=1 Tax=Seriola lalandi dorsalis TaxID=1841481 RepID=A0A3B4YUU5_SERLL
MRFQCVCLLLMLLSATVLLHDADLMQRYKKFKKQHICDSMTFTNCDDVMQKRHISGLNKKCKRINTFILANIKQVKSICDIVPYDNVTISNQCFDIVVCNLTQQKAKLAKCQYSGQKIDKKLIIIKCEQGYPVHYFGDRDCIEDGKLWP